MQRLRNRLGMISAALLGTWFAAVASHHLERSVELFPLMALVAGLVEVARKHGAHNSGLRNTGNSTTGVCL